MHKSWETKFYMVAPNVISIIIAVFLCEKCDYQCMYIERNNKIEV